MRFVLEAAFVVVAAAPAAALVALVKLTPGSLVSGVAIGAVVPALAGASLLLMAVGAVLALGARRQRRRYGHLVLGIVLASPLAILVGAGWLFG